MLILVMADNLGVASKDAWSSRDGDDIWLPALYVVCSVRSKVNSDDDVIVLLF